MKFNEWCTGCKEYDTEKHCCPRFNNVIRNTLNDSINAILDKIKAEIEELQKDYQEYGWAYDDALEIIDKYKAESEENNVR